MCEDGKDEGDRAEMQAAAGGSTRWLPTL